MYEMCFELILPVIESSHDQLIG